MVTKKKKKKAASTSPVDAAVDPSLKARYDALVEEIEEADRDEKHGWDRKYEAAGEIIDKKLYLLSPHGTVEKWCAAMLDGQKYRSVARNVRVARYCSPEDEHDYGTAKLDALLTYLDSKTNGLKAGGVKVALDKVRIPIVEGKKTRRVGLADATVKQILTAAKGENAKSKDPRRSPVEAAFARPLASDRALAGVSVRVSDGKLSFGAIPLTALDRFLKAVKAVDWEAELPD